MIGLAEKKWLFKTGSDAGESKSLQEALGIHPVLVELLLQRGIKTYEEAKSFFRPSLDDLCDPMLMKDMDKAVERIIQARENSEKVLILGDYDVDGTTATALLYMFLDRCGLKAEYYIPDRYAEGYGVSSQSIDYAIAQKFDLMISLDCGIKAIEQVGRAREGKVDFIICDHHNPGEKLPNANAILDPKRKDCNYPDKSLSGCGVAFKLCQALAQKLEVDPKLPFENLDLLATSIAADIVPITGENRILTREGLTKLNTSPSPGIAALKELAGDNKEYTISDVVFRIAPRINSAGRMSSGKKAVDILVSAEKELALKGVEEINVFNEERKNTDQDITRSAMEMVKNDGGFEYRSTTVLYDPSWHKGVIGIVASRMIETYYRPTIIFTGHDGVLSGSARSVRNFDLYAALEECEDLLIQYGGHKYAAGMTLREENFEAFSKRFDEVVMGRLTEEHLQPTLEIDAVLSLQDINPPFYRILKQFAPFGPGNMNPIFLSKNILVSDFRKLVDKRENEHLKFRVFDPELPSHSLDVIGFGLGNKYDLLGEGVMLDILYHIEENTWNGRTNIQLVAKDLRSSVD